MSWSLYLSPDGGTLHLSGLTPQGRAREVLSSAASFVGGQWELITLNYGPDASELWIGDEQLSRGRGLTRVSAGSPPVQGLVIGSDLAVTAPACGQFEELTTFDRWPEAEQLAFYFNGVSRQVMLGTVDSPEEEAIKQEMLAAAFPQIMMMESGGGGMPMAYSYGTNDLWLEIAGVSNGVANLILHNTDSAVWYEVLSKEDLTQMVWVPEASSPGHELQDWTAFDIPTWQTNALLFRARTGEDSDTDGLPDWWELEFFGDLDEVGGDDPDGDGLTHLEEYLAGTHPLSVVRLFVASPKPMSNLP